MLYRHRARRPVCFAPILSPRAARVLLVLVVLAAVSAFFIQSSLYLRQLACEMALSDAIDSTTLWVNQAIADKLAEKNYDYDYFVTLERNNEGDVAAVTSNMTRINAFSAELLRTIVNASSNGELDLAIPVGNLMGSSLLLGRGPRIPVEVTMLTSSRVDMKNELVSAGINQTKHQIKLDVVIDIDVILPWKTVSTEIVTEILVAETVIVGNVPDSYFNMG